MKVIAVTGSAGAGKTTYARRLAKSKGYAYFDVGAFLRNNKIYDYYDKSLKTYVVNVGELGIRFGEVIGSYDKKGCRGLVLDGHLSHYLPSKLLDSVVVIRCDVKTLRKRLAKRRYSRKKIEENIEAEIMESCLIEAEELGHTVKIVDGKGIKQF